jgi:hypothetical protein
MLSIDTDHTAHQAYGLWRRWIGSDAPTGLSISAWMSWATWVAWFGLSRRVKASVAASLLFLGGGCALAILFALGRPLGAEPVVLFQDLTPKPGEPLFAGIFQGVLNLANAAFVGAALLVAIAARPLLPNDARVRFLAVGGALLGIVVADDALMLHERILPPLIHTTDRQILALLAFSAIGVGFTFLRVILRHGGGVLAMAIIPVLSVSLLSDAGFFPETWEFVELLEEAGEMFATLGWGWLLAIVAREVIADVAGRRSGS